MKSQLRPAIVSLVLFTILTGAIYPLVVTGLGLMLFPHEARGSVIDVDGKPVGSRLIAQSFTAPQYFWSRPSANGYNGAASGGSNLGTANLALKDAVAGRIVALKSADPGNAAPVPVDLVTASASGLDPHISPAAAEYQIARVARVRQIPVERVQGLVKQFTETRTFGFLGEPRVNVLLLNLALDGKVVAADGSTKDDGTVGTRWPGTTR